MAPGEMVIMDGDAMRSRSLNDSGRVPVASASSSWSISPARFHRVRGGRLPVASAWALKWPRKVPPMPNWSCLPRLRRLCGHGLRAGCGSALPQAYIRNHYVGRTA
ncbi:MAG: hypothetical protein V8Q84_11580, partial [Bilophila sp.]